jgi:hypothetical protein
MNAETIDFTSISAVNVLMDYRTFLDSLRALVSGF